MPPVIDEGREAADQVKQKVIPSNVKIITLTNKSASESGKEEYQYIREVPKREFKPDLSKLAPVGRIYKAYKNIRGIVRRTPLTHSMALSEKFGANIYLKRED